MRYPFACTSLLISLLCGAGAANAATILTNGGFETGDFTGWTVNANATRVVTSGFNSFAPHSGTYFAALGDTARTYPYGTLAQTVTDDPGRLLSLTYSLASDGAQPNYFDATWNGNLIAGSIVTSPVRTGYIQYAFTVTSTGSDTLLFHEQDVPDYWALDDVSLAYATSPVPLPGAAPLFAAALLGLGMVGYGCKRGKVVSQA